jgi:hypothetical protein
VAVVVEGDDERVHKLENLARRDVVQTEVYQPAAGSLTSLCQTSLDSDPVRHSYNRQAPASLSFIERPIAVSERRDQRRGQPGVTTVYGAEFQTEKGGCS